MVQLTTQDGDPIFINPDHVWHVTSRVFGNMKREGSAIRFINDSVIHVQEELGVAAVSIDKTLRHRGEAE